MAEETWHAARLIPTSGINGADEQERRGTSALLAVMSSVREFGRALTTQFGAPAGTLETFIEVPFEFEGRRVFPDGLIRANRGSRTWTALVEVKTGTNPIGRDQLECYLDVAREQGFDAVVTISNEIASVPGAHPTAVDKRKLKKVALHHLSWTQVLTEAVMQKVHRGVADPDQAWILGELIRYLEHPRSGAMAFDDMGASWVPLREAISAGTLRPADRGAVEIAGRWDQLIRFSALRMGRQLGIEVAPALSRKELAEPALRAQALVDSLVRRGALEGGLRIPNAVGPVQITADIRASRLTASVDIEAPREGRASTRINWLLRQLKDASDGLRVDAFALHSRAGTSALLKDVRNKPEVLIEDPKRELRTFRLTLSVPMGTKRSQGRGSFVTSVLDLVDEFYRSVVQNLKPWSAAPPKLRPEPTEVAEPGVATQLVSTAMSSQDEVDTVEDVTPPTWHPDPVEEDDRPRSTEEDQQLAPDPDERSEPAKELVPAVLTTTWWTTLET
ncbi:MAG: hypothetical protein LC792_05885, partial [Actinobacteria bacterium]|nr:hypothetical protein [Actinomycetota bacterium]